MYRTSFSDRASRDDWSKPATMGDLHMLEDRLKAEAAKEKAEAAREKAEEQAKKAHAEYERTFMFMKAFCIGCWIAAVILFVVAAVK